MKNPLEQAGSATEPFSSELIFRYNIAAKLAEALRDAEEELRLIRMKDTAAVYDPTLRARIRIALAEWDAS